MKSPTIRELAVTFNRILAENETAGRDQLNDLPVGIIAGRPGPHRTTITQYRSIEFVSSTYHNLTGGELGAVIVAGPKILR